MRNLRIVVVHPALAVRTVKCHSTHVHVRMADFFSEASPKMTRAPDAKHRKKRCGFMRRECTRIRKEMRVPLAADMQYKVTQSISLEV